MMLDPEMSRQETERGGSAHTSSRRAVLADNVLSPAVATVRFTTPSPAQTCIKRTMVPSGCCRGVVGVPRQEWRKQNLLNGLFASSDSRPRRGYSHRACENPMPVRIGVMQDRLGSRRGGKRLQRGRVSARCDHADRMSNPPCGYLIPGSIRASHGAADLGPLTPSHHLGRGCVWSDASHTSQRGGQCHVGSRSHRARREHRAAYLPR
jgi:hypothetical protein